MADEHPINPERAPEQLPRPESLRPERETRREQDREREAKKIEQAIEGASETEVQAETPSARPAPQPTAPQPKDPLVEQIETILTEDLAPMYRAMTPDQQQQFRQEGAQAVTFIRQALEHVKIKTKPILEIIRKWLKLIPGINKFFLEQEAKIKTDRVLALHERIHRGDQ